MDPAVRADFYYVERTGTDRVTGVRGSYNKLDNLSGTTYLDSQKLERSTDLQNVDVGRHTFEKRVFTLENYSGKISQNNIIVFEDRIYEIQTVEKTGKNFIIHTIGTDQELNFHDEGTLMQLSLTMTVEVIE